MALAELKTGHLASLDTLLGSTSGALEVLLSVIDGSLPPDIRKAAISKGSALPDPLRRDFFERFLPESDRRRVLGTVVTPAQVLDLTGDAGRGRTVFAGVCVACHRVNGEGIDFGSDLNHIAAKWDRSALLEQILHPSKVIDPTWLTTTVELKQGNTKVGFVTDRNDRELILKGAGGVTEKLARSDIRKTSTSPLSLMPEGLLQNLTAQEAADLLAFLQSLK